MSKRFQLGGGFARLDDLQSKFPTIRHGFTYSGHKQGGGGIQQDRIQFGSGYFAGQDLSDEIGIDLGITSGQIADTGFANRE